jgi:hypothetical protein
VIGNSWPRPKLVLKISAVTLMYTLKVLVLVADDSSILMVLNFSALLLIFPVVSGTRQAITPFPSLSTPQITLTDLRKTY